MSIIERNPNGNGGPHQPTQERQLLSTSLIPTGTMVAEGEEDALGKVAILMLLIPGAQTNVVLSPDDAERVGKELVEAARKLRSGLVIAGQSDVDRIAERRARTDEMRRQGPKG